MKNFCNLKISKVFINYQRFSKKSNIIINSWKFLSRNMVPKVIAKSPQSHRRKTCYSRRFRKVIAAKHVIYDVLTAIAKSSRSHRRKARYLRRIRKAIAAKHVIYVDFAKSPPQSTLFTENSQGHRSKARYLRRIRKAIAARQVIYDVLAPMSSQSHRKVIAKSSPLSSQEFP